MDYFNIILSSSFGPISSQSIPEFRALLSQYANLKSQLPVRLHLVLGNKSEDLVSKIPELENFELHFNSDEETVLIHCLDTLLSGLDKTILCSNYPCPPLKQWVKYLDWAQDKSDSTKLKFCLFGKNFPGPQPVYITDSGLAYLRSLFRQKNRQQLLDFDWRNAKYMAKKSTTNKSRTKIMDCIE